MQHLRPLSFDWLQELAEAQADLAKLSKPTQVRCCARLLVGVRLLLSDWTTRTLMLQLCTVQEEVPPARDDTKPPTHAEVNPSTNY